MNNGIIKTDGSIEIVDDLMKWAAWLESCPPQAHFSEGGRTVANTEIGNARISTVFLGIDHGWSGTPAWFETMIFGGEHDGYQDRYSTWQQAAAGNDKAVAMVKASQKNC